MVAEMRLAYEVAKYAPTDADARMLVRHVIMRAQSFIEHARAIRKPLNLAGFRTDDFHKTKEAYADFFREYFQTARDRLGAHVQDLDFGKRIELWNEIETVKVDFFVEGAKEIYESLHSLAIPGYQAYADFPEMGDPGFTAALESYRDAVPETPGAYFGADPLAMTRPNSVSALNLSPVHARAGQLALIHRWIKAEGELLTRFAGRANLVRVLKAMTITDVVSFCDRMVTRPVAVGAPQQMDGLDKLLVDSGVSSAPIDQFVSNYDFVGSLNSVRQVRNQIGGHVDGDETVTLTSLLNILDTTDLEGVMSFYSKVRGVFEKVCRSVIFLRMYLADGQRLYGVTANSAATVPFDTRNLDRQIAPVPEGPLEDTDTAYATKLEEWLHGDQVSQQTACRYFWRAFMSSAVVEEYITTQHFPGGLRNEFHKFRRAHKFLLDALASERKDERVLGMLMLACRCRSGDPDVLAELVLRFSKASRAGWYDVAISHCFGELAKWTNEEAKEFLKARLSINGNGDLMLQARISLLRMFVASEGLIRINRRIETESFANALGMLTAGLKDEIRLIVQIVLASQFCDPLLATFRPKFLNDYKTIQQDIALLSDRMLQGKVETEFADMLHRLMETDDYVGVCLWLFDHLAGGENEPVARELLRLACRGAVIAAHHDQAQRHLAGCFLRLEEMPTALQIAEWLATRNPDDVGHQILRLQILAAMPDATEDTRKAANEIRSRYALTPDHEKVLSAVEA